MYLRNPAKYPNGKPNEGVDALWYAKAQCYSYVVDGYSYGSTSVQLELWWVPVRKRTPCGAWLYQFESKFVNLKCRKKFACETEAEAIEQVMFRKKRYASILSARLSEAESAIRLAEQALAFYVEK